MLFSENEVISIQTVDYLRRDKETKTQTYLIHPDCIRQRTNHTLSV
jgi:hypothetical protein